MFFWFLNIDLTFIPVVLDLHLIKTIYICQILQLAIMIYGDLLTNTFFVILNNCEMTDFKGLHDQKIQKLKKTENKQIRYKTRSQHISFPSADLCTLTVLISFQIQFLYIFEF